MIESLDQTSAPKLFKVKSECLNPFYFFSHQNRRSPECRDRNDLEAQGQRQLESLVLRYIPCGCETACSYSDPGNWPQNWPPKEQMASRASSCLTSGGGVEAEENLLSSYTSSLNFFLTPSHLPALVTL